MDNIQSSPLDSKIMGRILDDYQRLVAENASMRLALQAIQLYAERRSFGFWRGVVMGLAERGLGKQLDGQKLRALESPQK